MTEIDVPALEIRGPQTPDGPSVVFPLTHLPVAQAETWPIGLALRVDVAVLVAGRELATATSASLRVVLWFERQHSARYGVALLRSGGLARLDDRRGASIYALPQAPPSAGEWEWMSLQVDAPPYRGAESWHRGSIFTMGRQFALGPFTSNLGSNIGSLRELRVQSVFQDPQESWRIAEVRLWKVPGGYFEAPPSPRYERTRLTGREPDLLGYWRIDEGAGRTLRDSSPWGNHGMVNGEFEWIGSSGLLLDDAAVRAPTSVAVVARRVARDCAVMASRCEALRSETALVGLQTTARGVVMQEQTRAADAAVARTEAVIASEDAEFAAWKHDILTGRTSLKRFVEAVTTEVQGASRRLDRLGRPYALADAALDVRLASLEAAPAGGGVSAIRPETPAVVETDAPHGLQTGDRVVLIDAAASLNRRRLRVAPRGESAFEIWRPDGTPIDGGALEPYAGGGRWEQRDQFQIRFPQQDETSDDDASRLSRLRFAFDLAPPPERERGKILVPDVLGYTEALARRKLAAAGLMIETFEVATADSHAGAVISQRPRAGASVDPNSAVALFVARAPLRPGSPA